MSLDKLFTPCALGALTLPNRIVMAPMTRSRAGQPGDVPTAMNATYYAQRASAGLIVTEATQVMDKAQGYAWTPGIFTAEQIAGWRLVTDAVHAAGGRIFLQIWHVGRISHPALLGGVVPIAPSAIAAEGATAFIVDEQGPRHVPTATPQALALTEIPTIIDGFAQAARNAVAVGFDGVEVHGANGYLLDQFLESGSNQRSDAYGGSVEKRARLLLEVVDAVSAAIGAERTGVRLSPLGRFNGMSDDDPLATFAYAATELDRRGLAYLHLNDQGSGEPAQKDAIWAEIRRRYRGTLILCGGYDADSAEAAIASGQADLIAFGRPYIANPDLVERYRRGAALNPTDEASIYGGAEHGYIDYPALAD